MAGRGGHNVWGYWNGLVRGSASISFLVKDPWPQRTVRLLVDHHARRGRVGKLARESFN